MPQIHSKPHIDGCNDYKMRIEYLLNPVEVAGSYDFFYDQPFSCTRNTIIANIEKVCWSSPNNNDV